MTTRPAVLLTALLSILCLFHSGTALAESPISAAAKLPPIYDPTADGTAQIAEALTSATRENKRVMIQFGGNWCSWCHRLHAFLADDQELSATLRAAYVTVLIDQNDRTKPLNEKYGNPWQFGFPVIVILAPDGAQLTTKNTSELEEGKTYNREKVLSFLREWTPKK